MTNENRAVKILQLAKVCKWVDGQGIDDYGTATLLWPLPKDRQYATIDIKDGKVVRYVHQTGSAIEEVHPDTHIGTIDRRINYLKDRYREAIARVAKL